MRTKFRVGTTDQVNSRRGRSGEVLLALDVDKKPILRVLNGIIPGGFQIPGKQAVANIWGPGAQELVAGTLDRGYFGFMQPSELITPNELFTKTGFTAGDPTNGRTAPQGWLKLIRNKKVLYVSRGIIRRSWSGNNVSPAQLINANLAYGGSSGQRVTLNGVTYIIRLLTGDGIDSEWNQLIYPLHQSDPNGDKWGINFTNEDLDINTSLNMATNCINTARDTLLVRGSTSLTTSAASGQYAIWRPVLEPIDP